MEKQPSALAETEYAAADTFAVHCLCAEWCGTCREYQPGFQALASQFPGVRFVWLDIEERADDMGDLDVENFPTLLIGRAGLVLFYGPMLPQHKHLRRMIEQLLPLSLDESREHAFSGEAHRAWQENADLRRLCGG